MDERLKENELFQTSHIMILTCYTMFASILIGESFLLGWESWALILIVTGIACAWIVHIRAKFSEYTRLWIYSLLMMATFFFYGIHATSTYDLSAVMTAVISMYTMTGVSKLIFLCQGTYFLTFGYDIGRMIRDGVQFTPLEVTRALLHIALIIMVGWIARVIIDRWGRVLGRVGREMAVLKEGTERLNDFLANVSHEIRTPVNAVMGFTGVCMEKEKDDEIRHNMGSVMEAGRRIHDQISDILDYSEIYRKSLAINREDYVLSSIIFDVTSQLAPFMNPSCELIIDIDPKVCAVMNSDTVKLKKILRHLLENGIKYTPEGGVYAHIFTIEEDYGVNLCIEVEDTGIGMEEGEAENSLLGFYQGDSSRTRKGGGLGLGLAIVHGFVSALGGFMMVKSRAGAGTKISISLPQQVIDPTSCMALAEKDSLCLGAFIRFEKFANPDVREYYARLMTSVVSGMDITIHRTDSFEELVRLCETVSLTHLVIGKEEYEAHTSFMENLAKSVVVVIMAKKDFVLPEDSLCVHGMKPVTTFTVAESLNMKPGKRKEDGKRMVLDGVSALVVDDEPMNLSVAKGILKKYGMAIDTAVSGFEAVDLTDANEYDIVFMDHMMPGMDGVETAERIWRQCSKKEKKTAIVALTANAVSTAKEMFLSKGFDDFISKPIELHELERVLKRVLPAEKIHYEFADDHEQTASGTEEKSAPEQVLSGVDMRQGMAHCQNDEEFYRSILEQYASEAGQKAQTLREAFEAEDYKSYEIHVHALKSTSKLIGALALSETAKSMEETASAGKKIPEDIHERMLKDYLSIAEAIASYTGADLSEGGRAGTAGGVSEAEPGKNSILEFEAE